jgi:hypothetical protein
VITLFLLIARVFALRSYLRARRSRVAAAVLGPQLQEERTALLRRLFRAVGAVSAAKKSRMCLAPAPRHDEVFYKGVRALDEMDAPTLLPPLEPGVYQRVDGVDERRAHRRACPTCGGSGLELGPTQWDRCVSTPPRSTS